MIRSCSNDALVLAYYQERGRVFNEPTHAISREVDGKILGAFVFTGDTGETIQMHIAGQPGWLNRELLDVAFTYAFDVRGSKVIIAAVPGSNPKALKIGRQLGFTEFGALREVDLHLLKMSRAQCRWIRNG